VDNREGTRTFRRPGDLVSDLTVDLAAVDRSRTKSATSSPSLSRPIANDICARVWKSVALLITSTSLPTSDAPHRFHFTRNPRHHLEYFTLSLSPSPAPLIPHSDLSGSWRHRFPRLRRRPSTPGSAMSMSYVSPAARHQRFADGLRRRFAPTSRSARLFHRNGIICVYCSVDRHCASLECRSFSRFWYWAQERLASSASSPPDSL
jgi:hypothetical protein